MDKRLSDHTIVEQLLSPDERTNDDILRYLHRRLYPMICRFLLNNKGSQADADDIFQEALIAIFKMVRQGKVDGNVNIEAYIYSICRNLWLKRLHKYRKETELTDEMTAIPTEDAGIKSFIDDDQKAAVEALFQQLGDDCRKVLMYYYYERRSMKEIMKLMNYSSEQVAKNKKSRCMKKLNELIADSKEQFRSLFNK
ncbi:MAG: sigma-70 family RNA polymerase sigma factor [Bacteroidota bacterium]